MSDYVDVEVSFRAMNFTKQTQDDELMGLLEDLGVFGGSDGALEVILMRHVEFDCISRPARWRLFQRPGCRRQLAMMNWNFSFRCDFGALLRVRELVAAFCASDDIQRVAGHQIIGQTENNLRCAGSGEGNSLM